MGRGKQCFCEIPASHFQSGSWDYEGIFNDIPDVMDVTIYGNDSNEGIQTCKILLAMLGAKLDKLLTESEIKLDYPLAIIRIINEFALSGELHCDESNIVDLLTVAKEYDLCGIKKFGGIFLLSLVSSENVLRIYDLAEKLLCSHFTFQAKAYILVNFQDLAVRPDFLQSCTAKRMKDLIKNDELNASEEMIFTMLEDWAKLSRENADFFQELVNYIRFPILKPNFFDQVVKTSDLLKGNAHIKRFEQSLRRCNGRSLRFRKEKFRLPYELVFAVGGFETEALPIIEVFDIRAKKWTVLKQKLPSHAYHGVVVFNNRLFIFGGYGDEGLGHGPTFYRSIYCFDLIAKSWSKLTPEMGSARCYVSVVVGPDRLIYTIGGYDGQQRLRSVEKFDPETGNIFPSTPMHDVRSDASAVTHGNKIFIVGGYTGQEVLSSVEIYNPNSDTWTYGPALNIPRSGLKAVVLENTLFAIGGFDGVGRTRTVETLDLQTPGAAWVVSNSELNVPRSNFGVTVVDKAILVAGGFEGFKVTNQCEIFQVKKNTWEFAEQMNGQKSALTLVTVSDLANRKQYLPYWKTV